MVGLSLIVGLVVFNSSFRSGWQFPQHFPQAFIWSFDQIDGDIDAAVASVGGIKEYTAGNTVNIIVEERIPGLDRIQLSMTWFVGVDPDGFFDLVHVDFLEGDQETACELLRKGGYVIIASDFARTRRKGVKEVLDEDGNVLISDKVRVWYGNQWYTFKVAGVIDSPALDIAASFFQVESEAHVVATGSVLGTNADMERLFKIHGKKLILLNYDLPPEEPPPGWTPPSSDAPAGRPTDDFYNRHLPLASRYQFYRETELLYELRAELGISQSKHGTARELKDEIDAELTKITYLLSAVPAVALLVAAIGVANLMTANVASRNRQIAIMRAVGATRGLILRLVVGEALVLGVLGSGLGLALGLHLAWNTTTMALRMWGFEVPFSVPWTFVGAAIAMTVGLCILAGIAPARHAARTNVIDALHVS
jgi:putative ABC transport system permease protein